ncbi:MAG: endonuclease/exonuclease/phosphatase family protein [Bacteroidia bacterium]|nr:endonuclease/exonuclease/phosphatase family protein [Bacteroidia bacterium]MDW8133895.1 endonuclease/exonuclease/phosphatase family protein [Bacteroidia bacterium]
MILLFLSWYVPPWVWSVPLGIGVIWPYLGLLLCGWGIWKDKKYRIFWVGGLLGWGLSLGVVWQLWPTLPQSSSCLRIASFNMDGAHYNRKQIERLADSLRKWHPHILCLQEVFLGDYTVEKFAKRLGYANYAFLDAGAHMGMLVLSDLPILRSYQHYLLPGSTNGIQEVRLQMEKGSEVVLLNVHFPSYRLGSRERWSFRWLRIVWNTQRYFAFLLLRLIDLHKSNLLGVCGDFNAPPYYPLYRQLRSRLYDAFEVASWGEGPTWRYPWLRIDYVWCSAPPVRYKVRWLEGQSHGYVEGGFAVR